MTHSALARLHAILDQEADWTIAVSGGVDSLTLATLAHRHLAHPPAMVHASSPAVPADARARVENQVGAEGWRLEVVDAGEFADPDYRANPVNRCYFCKRSLYGTIRGLLAERAGAVASGTNTDDLGDFRPGLAAAGERDVRHPFVEAGIDKAMVRALARAHGLAFAEIPAQPCLASRVETGLRIEPEDLRFIDLLEEDLRRLLGPASVLRVRLRKAGVVVEHGLDTRIGAEAERLVRRACREAGRPFAAVEPYRRGSAFLREAP